MARGSERGEQATEIQTDTKGKQQGGVLIDRQMEREIEGETERMCLWQRRRERVKKEQKNNTPTIEKKDRRWNWCRG